MPKEKKKNQQKTKTKKKQNLSMPDLSEELASIKIPADNPNRSKHTERVKLLTVCLNLIFSPVGLTHWPFSFETEGTITSLAVIHLLSG